MSNLRDVRLRMRAIRQTLQVTKAMNLISTSKLRRGRRVLEDTEPYFTRIQKSMYDILSCVENVQSDFFRKADATKPGRTAIVVVSSDKGLAGGYNANVFRQVNELCEKFDNPILILIGTIGYRHFVHSPHVILENFSFHSQLPTVENAGEISDFIVSQFLWGMFDDVHIVYTHMYSAIKLQPTVAQILPLDAEEIQAELSNLGNVKRVHLHFEFIPSEKEVFDALVPLYIKGIIYGCMIESYASEQSARMTAMDEASKSAEDMLAGLLVNYNRARQAGITQEMTEIIGGSAALGN
ncbi:MAG: ATP synthase F1 subunit gamma [Treponema sp.]|nr:ATP synthase F1 subunit gamma [Treponema sp.]